MSRYMSDDPNYKSHYARNAALIAGAVLLFLVAVLTLIGGSLNRVQANEWGCLYGGGFTESHNLKQTIAPGTSGGLTMWDTLVTLPSDDRYYFIDEDPATADLGANKIVVPAQGTSLETTGRGIVNVSVEIQARFVLNEKACSLYTDKLKRLRPLNFDAKDGKSAGGWGTFLNTQLNQALIKAARPLVAPYNYIQLYSNSKVTIDGKEVLVYDYMEDQFSSQLTSELKSNLGDEFFCGPSYQFDGHADGKLETGCPPIEMTVKRVVPTDPQLIENLQSIVKNQEQIKVIQSEQEKALANTEAEKQKALAVTQADKEKQLAQTEADKATQLAAAAKDQEVAAAQKTLFEAQNANEQIKAQAATAFCAALAALNVDCAEYARAQNWKPDIILGGDGAGTNINITPTSVPG